MTISVRELIAILEKVPPQTIILIPNMDHIDTLEETHFYGPSAFRSENAFCTLELLGTSHGPFANMDNKCVSHFIELDELFFKLPKRAQNAMRCLNIESVEQLVKLTYKDFIGLPNIGKKTINEMEDILAKYGLKLARSH